MGRFLSLDSSLGFDSCLLKDRFESTSESETLLIAQITLLIQCDLYSGEPEVTALCFHLGCFCPVFPLQQSRPLHWSALEQSGYDKPVGSTQFTGHCKPYLEARQLVVVTAHSPGHSISFYRASSATQRRTLMIGVTKSKRFVFILLGKEYRVLLVPKCCTESLFWEWLLKWSHFKAYV